MVVDGLLEVTGISAAPLYVVIILGPWAVAIFVVPLLGIRVRRQEKKAWLLSRTNEGIKLTIDRIHGQVDSGDDVRIAALNTTLSALIAEPDLIESILTWPWESSTLRDFASSPPLPLFLVLATHLLERFM